MTICEICGVEVVVGDGPWCLPCAEAREYDALQKLMELETFTMTITDRPDGFRVPPDGEPHT